MFCMYVDRDTIDQEVQGKPALVSTRGSWERTKLAAQGARLRALQQERERAELEELKQQVRLRERDNR